MRNRNSGVAQTATKIETSGCAPLSECRAHLSVAFLSPNRPTVKNNSPVIANNDKRRNPHAGHSARFSPCSINTKDGIPMNAAPIVSRKHLGKVTQWRFPIRSIRLLKRRFTIFLPNVKEHATLSAGPHVDHGVEVEITEDHVNRAADRGCCVSSCSASCWLTHALNPNQT